MIDSNSPFISEESQLLEIKRLIAEADAEIFANDEEVAATFQDLRSIELQSSVERGNF